MPRMDDKRLKVFWSSSDAPSAYADENLNGVYINIPNDYYRAIPRINWSRLKLASRSHAHYHAGANISEKTSRLGRDMHVYSLEPERFEREYVVEPDWKNDPGNCTKNGERSYSAGTKFVKDSQKAFRAALGEGIKVVSESWYKEKQQQLWWLNKNEEARLLLMDKGYSEVVVLWTDAVTGQLCKCRLDRITPIGDNWVPTDIKGIDDATKFGRAIRRYQYNGQAAFYLDGLNTALDQRSSVFNFVPIEHGKPFCCMCAPLDWELLLEGRDTYRYLLRIVQGWEGEIQGYKNPEKFTYEDINEEVELEFDL